MTKKSNEIIVSCIRLMDDGNRNILPCVKYKDLKISELNEILSDDSFTMNATDEQSLVEQLQRREEIFYDDYENRTHTIFVGSVEDTEIYDYELEGNQVDVIAFYIKGQKIFQTL